MTTNSKYRFLFSIAMFSGNSTYYGNMRDIVSEMDDIDATWLPIEWNPYEWYVRIPPISFNWSVKGGLVTRNRVRALERAGQRYDAALFHHQMLPLWLYEFRKRVPTIITTDATPSLHEAYGKWYHKYRSSRLWGVGKLKKQMTRGVYDDAEYILPFSDWVKSSLVDEYHVTENKICVIPPGINLKVWNNPPARTMESGKHPFTVLFVGGQYLRKGGDLLTSIASLEEFKDVQFNIVTQGYIGQPLPNITVHTNVQPNSCEMRELYRTADVFILPTRADFHSWVCLEAMSMGLPVITTDVGAMHEIVADGKSGFIAPVDDTAVMVNRLLQLRDNVSLRRAFGKEGRAIVEQKFDLHRNIEKTISFMKLAADKRQQLRHCP
jgi:glycosyltransferase involved in cell wall biosynthesis